MDLAFSFQCLRVFFSAIEFDAHSFGISFGFAVIDVLLALHRFPRYKYIFDPVMCVPMSIIDAGPRHPVSITYPRFHMLFRTTTLTEISSPIMLPISGRFAAAAATGVLGIEDMTKPFARVLSQLCVVCVLHYGNNGGGYCQLIKDGRRNKRLFGYERYNGKGFMILYMTESVERDTAIRCFSRYSGDVRWVI